MSRNDYISTNGSLNLDTIFNNIDNNTSGLADNVAQMNDLFTSVSDGKSVLIASVTGKGSSVLDANSDGVSTFQEIANGVDLIQQGSGTAIASDLLLGKTASSDVGDIVGTKNLSNLIASNIKEDITIDGITGNVVEGIPLMPGEDIIASAIAVSSITINGGSYEKKKEVLLKQNGTIRITFKVSTSSSNNTVYAQIYKNNVPVGIERIINATTTFTEDIIFAKDDLIQLYGKKVGAYSASVSEFAIKINALPIAIVNLD